MPSETLKHSVGLNHLPSGRFAANAAWLAVQVMAHNIARWTARIGLGEQVVTTKTLRRRFFSLTGRITRSARRLTLLAASFPRYLALTNIRRRSQSLPAATEDRHRPPSTPNRARTIALPLPLSPVPLLHSHPFGGFGLSDCLSSAAASSLVRLPVFSARKIPSRYGSIAGPPLSSASPLP